MPRTTILGVEHGPPPGRDIVLTFNEPIAFGGTTELGITYIPSGNSPMSADGYQVENSLQLRVSLPWASMTGPQLYQVTTEPPRALISDLDQNDHVGICGSPYGAPNVSSPCLPGGSVLEYHFSVIDTSPPTVVGSGPMAFVCDANPGPSPPMSSTGAPGTGDIVINFDEEVCRNRTVFCHTTLHPNPAMTSACSVSSPWDASRPLG